MSQKKADLKAKKYAEDWLPIRSITNGMIQLESGFLVTGVKVLPKNIFILDSSSQDATIFNLKNMYNAIDYEFWLIVSGRPVDINVYLSQLQLLYNSSTTPSTRKMIMEDINKANMFMGKTMGITDTEYFIIFKEKRMEIIQKRIQSLIGGLASAGLQAVQVSNDDLRVLLDGFLNGGTSTELKAVIAE